MIPGLTYQAHALTEEQEQELLSDIDSTQWTPVTGSEKSRRVQHYGYRYDYKRRTVSEPTTEIPERWKEMLGEEKTPWNQVIINEYMPGQGISAHVDSLAYGDTILCYTLGSGAMMRFTPVEGSNERQELYVETRSLYRMTGDARYRWKHELAARKSDSVEGKKIQRGRRVSVTLRWVPVPAPVK